MKRRTFIQGLAAFGVVGAMPLPLSRAFAASAASPISVKDLPALEGDLTLYLGRGEGGRSQVWYRRGCSAQDV